LEARRLEIERKRSAESIESKDTHLHFSLAKKNTHSGVGIKGVQENSVFIYYVLQISFS